MKVFCKTYKFLGFVRESTCFKNPDNPSCIDLILTNKHLSFQRSCAIKTGLSDFHKMVLTVMKIHFPKRKPRIITCPKYKKIRKETFLIYLQHDVEKQRPLL